MYENGQHFCKTWFLTSLCLHSLILNVANLLFRWLGCKWTLVVSQVAYMPYIAAQAYAKFYTLVPAALLVGLGAGPLWCSQSVYLKMIAEVYAEHEGRPTSTILARFFGIFFTFYQTSEVWGNLISSSGKTVCKSGNKILRNWRLF